MQPIYAPTPTSRQGPTTRVGVNPCRSTLRVLPPPPHPPPPPPHPRRCPRFGFYIPDSEYLTDAEGLVQYLGAKMTQGGVPLCQSGLDANSKQFRSLHAVQVGLSPPPPLPPPSCCWPALAPHPSTSGACPRSAT